MSPNLGLEPEPTVWRGTDLLRIPKRLNYSTRNVEYLPTADRASAVCPFSPEAAAHVDILTLVTAGRTSPNIAAAFDAWVDLIGEPLPEETANVFKRFVAPPLPETVTENFVDKGLRPLLKQAFDAFNSPWEQQVESTYSGGENTTRIGHPDCMADYVMNDYYNHKNSQQALVIFSVVLSLPEARRAAGLIAADLSTANAKARRREY